MHSICAVVVTYNRKELLSECIDALLRQEYEVASIIVVDNASSDGTETLLKKKGYLGDAIVPTGKIEYLRLQENRGGAGGFAAGMKEALKKSSDFVWIMDDDAEPKKDCLRLLVEYIDRNPGTMAATPLKILPDGSPLLRHRGKIDFDHLFGNAIYPVKIEEIDKSKGVSTPVTHSSFVGLLASKEVINDIGYPDETLFIYYDDLDYSIRMAGKYALALIPESKIVHKERPDNDDQTGEIKRFLLWTSKRKIKYTDLWRSYYSLRNRLYLAKKYQVDRYSFVISVLGFVARSAVGILLFDDHKIGRLKVLWISIRHGLQGKLGRTIDPGAWIKRAEQ